MPFLWKSWVIHSAHCIHTPHIWNEVGVDEDIRAVSKFRRGLDLHLV